MIWIPYWIYWVPLLCRGWRGKTFQFEDHTRQDLNLAVGFEVNQILIWVIFQGLNFYYWVNCFFISRFKPIEISKKIIVEVLEISVYFFSSFEWLVPFLGYLIFFFLLIVVKPLFVIRRADLLNKWLSATSRYKVSESLIFYFQKLIHIFKYISLCAALR